MRAAPRPVLASVVLSVALALLPRAAPGTPAEVPPGWVWPAETFRLSRPFEAPAHRYGPGHRGVDLEPSSPRVRAPADGVVAFAGPVAGRGVVTIDHGDGWVTTLEPVDPLVAVGERVEAGSIVAELGTGGHAASGSLHFGVRRDGEYVNPLLLLGGVPRAVLLPCC